MLRFAHRLTRNKSHQYVARCWKSCSLEKKTTSSCRSLDIFSGNPIPPETKNIFFPKGTWLAPLAMRAPWKTPRHDSRFPSDVEKLPKNRTRCEYCGWKKSYTTSYLWNPIWKIGYCMFCSQLVKDFFHQQYYRNKHLLKDGKSDINNFHHLLSWNTTFFFSLNTEFIKKNPFHWVPHTVLYFFHILHLHLRQTLDTSVEESPSLWRRVR